MKRFLAFATAATILGSTAVLAAPPTKKKATDLWVCPMQGSVIKTHVGAGKGMVVSGRVIHFCCAGCKPEFSKLTQKEKELKVAAAVKKEADAKKQ
jgi:hypothetical protein